LCSIYRITVITEDKFLHRAWFILLDSCDLDNVRLMLNDEHATRR